MDARLRRVNKEIAVWRNHCKNDKTSNISIDLIDSSPFHLKGSFPGPKDTPVRRRRLEVDIVDSESYPFQPVKMKFHHQNAWSPVLTLKSTLISLQSLLCSPEPNDPQDAEVAKHYMTSQNSFEETARYGRRPMLRGRSQRKGRYQRTWKGRAQFEGLGFERSKVIDVLRRLNYRGSNVANIPDDENNR
ncbi:ubiquitin-conjugating enzyme/RWD-like protein [Pisolithus microcarpus]|nr:ubiquitin-conjugating enzyme/RWD-like protein [Pisolithus microcarpus]